MFITREVGGRAAESPRERFKSARITCGRHYCTCNLEREIGLYKESEITEVVPVEDTEISESESVENQDSEEEAVESPFPRSQGTEEFTILYEV